MVPNKLKRELEVIEKVSESEMCGLPIAERPSQPSLSALVFYSDAAGVSYTWSNGERYYHNNKGRRGLHKWNKARGCVVLEQIKDFLLGFFTIFTITILRTESG